MIAGKGRVTFPLCSFMQEPLVCKGMKIGQLLMDSVLPVVMRIVMTQVSPLCIHFIVITDEALVVGCDCSVLCLAYCLLLVSDC